MIRGINYFYIKKTTLKCLSNLSPLKNIITIQSCLCKRNYISGNLLSLSDRGIWLDRFPPSNVAFEQNLTSKSLTAYSGFDPTANSLHIGNLLVLVALLHFQRCGHNVIALIGGATGRVGDPSGKNKERPLLNVEDVDRNSEAISINIESVFYNHKEFIWKPKTEKEILPPIKIVNNYDWYKKLSVTDFLRDAGKHMRMGALLKRSSIETRLESNAPLSYTEFSYQIMQAFDWYHLYRKYNCSVQIGGSDQMGNIMSGHQLISKIEDVQVTGLTVPLITSESGDKLGKSSGSPVWLSPEKTTPFELYQFFFRTKDSEVENLLKLLTFVPLSEINTLMEIHKEDSSAQKPQKKLAEQLTLLVFGEKGLLSAKRSTELLYHGNATHLLDMSTDELIALFKNSDLHSAILKPGTTILELAMLAGCFSSEERAFDVIKRGGFYVNLGRVTDPLLGLIPGVHILPNGISLLRVGKKNYYLVQWKS